MVGLNLTYRKITDILQQDLLVFDGNGDSDANLNSVGRRATRSDYVLGGTLTGTLPDGSSFSRPYYVIYDSLTTRGGHFLYNGDDEQTYKGASLVFTKRLANRWMLRGNVTYSDWYWSAVPSSSNPDPTQLLGGGFREGDAVLQGSGTASGSKAGVYINSKWAYSVNGLYQVSPDRPWGFNVALNLNGREGYPVPYYVRQVPAGQLPQRRGGPRSGHRPSRLVPVGEHQHRPTPASRRSSPSSDFGLTLGVDCFNLLNESYGLQHQHRIGISTSDNVTEITSPRIFRLGARLSFR